MSRTFDKIDLSALPAPKLIETLSAEQVVTAIKDDLKKRMPTLAATLDLESEPIVKLIEQVAYREVLLRARINTAARSVLVSHATGSDLDHLGAVFGVKRKTLRAADPDAVPPVKAVMETDQDYRQRIPLSLEAHSTAGAAGGYRFHALAVSGVRDVAVRSIKPGEVQVAILARAGTGVPDAALLDAVRRRLNSEDVRPLCDRVVVSAAVIKSYRIRAALTIGSGPDAGVVLAAARKAAQAYADQRHKLGADIARSGIFAALHDTGVEAATLTAPAADIAIGWNEVAYCTDIDVTEAAS